MSTVTFIEGAAWPHLLPKQADGERTYRWTRWGGYEVSTLGDRRFSAFCCYLPCNRTIEQVYQCDVKGYDPGGTNWRLGKGKPPIDPNVDLWEAYLGLWTEWAERNPDRMAMLKEFADRAGGILSDSFASTPVNQAHALAVLLSRRWSPPEVMEPVRQAPMPTRTFRSRGQSAKAKKPGPQASLI